MNKRSIIRNAVEPVADACEVQFVDAERVGAARRGMKPARAVALLAETFKLLGDPTRIRIVQALALEELCVCDLANLLGVSSSVASHSLRSLRQMNLVRLRKEGKVAYYSLADDHIRQLLDLGFDHVGELV